MAECAPLLLRLIASSVTAATRAGKIIRDVMSKGELGIVEKSKNNLQTEADRSAQSCIMASLTKQYPNITIIGEEGPSSLCDAPPDSITTELDESLLHLKCPSYYEDILPEDIVIWVDPLDGTSEYTQGLVEHVTVLIGIAVKGSAVAGVIHQPYFKKVTTNNGESLGRTFWGLIGLGVGGEIEPRDPPSGRLIVTTTRSHSNELVQKTLDALKPDEVLRVGGAGHKVILLIEGKAHVYVFGSKGCKKWDTCAPEAVLRAVGGKLTDVFGNVYDYSKNVEHPNAHGVLATSHQVSHAAFVAKIPQDVRESLSKL